MASSDGRFAPSPSGPLHLGNLRTALVAWLRARSQGARFLVRIEDLDRGRSRPEHEAAQLRELAVLGLDWDAPPVRQSARDALYAAAVARLAARDLVYPCWCTRAEIREAAGAPHGDLPEGAYPGTCAGLSAAERAERERTGRPAALRVRAGAARATAHDLVRGEIVATVDDFVVRRGDGTYAYNLAVVVDDGDQGVGEVVRGDDLASSAPRQAWLAGVLGVPVPTYLHVPLVLGPDGRRLAKRDGAVTLEDREALGEDAAAVRARLAASLGLCSPDERPTAQELVARFDVALLRGAGPLRWDPVAGPLPAAAG
ncbi:tRNA glutamyl-Q(34) synthetase GluQRS [Patulibacter sp. SYSU D01012]|uniref:tRNA glutamyl-Q(34) synthetase GluQRS n=1 Tax=Patulibacter sp. SYSU D01012 TaxID=2817381 RepID=UPI001B30274F|nr:tRNA glutamyl-Q(34) synthetase GluQRS [Patulibacter sp. SYSU D01012]